MRKKAKMTLEQVAKLAEQISPADKWRLIEQLTREMQTACDTASSLQPPQSLRGIWQGCFPEDPDVDAVLDEIRHEWQKEWPEVFHR